MQPIAYIDGSRDQIDSSDRGFAYGDGLFETMVANNGAIQWLDFHLDRLLLGCARLQISPPPRNEIEAEICGRLPARGRSIVKLVLTRGNSSRGYAPPVKTIPTVVITVFSAESDVLPAKPVATELLQFRLAEQENLAGIKHLCRIEQVLAQLELRTRGLEEGILLSRSGTVVGCTSANLFALTGETLVTPRIELTGINGVMRRVVLEACTRAAIPVREAVMVPAELISADALFLTNAVVGIREIQSLGMQTFASASICDRVRKAVAEYADA